ncbi:MAG TPA: MDR family MFS transporter [Xanthobacteraceae bacterium]|nr:MDR family MFS transporter [Xanthobacteraceae bacterium]
MSKFDAPGNDPDELHPLSEAAAAEIAALPTEVIGLDEAPSHAAPGQPAHPPLAHSDVRTILMSLMLTMFLTALDQTIVATALPTIGRQFQDVSLLSWVITAYLLSSTAVAPLFGTLSDIYGRRAMLILSMSLFLVGSVLCALAPNMLALILARGLQGLGGGGILPLVQIVISDVVTPRERGRYQAYFSGVWMTAGIGGPILGGIFAEHLHWTMIFWINVPIGILSMALLLPKMHLVPTYHRVRTVDWVGGGLLMSSAVVVLLVLTWGGNRYAWLSDTLLAMIGCALALAVAFVWHARRSSEPFLPLPLLGGSVVPYAIVAGACVISTMIGLTVTLPLYYETVYHLAASEAGLALIPIVAMSVPGAALGGRAMSKIKHYKRVAIAGTACGAVVMSLITLMSPLPLWPLLIALSVFAFGVGTVFPISVVSIQNAVARHQVGTATGAANFFRSLMASFAVAAFSSILLMSLGTNISIGGEHISAARQIAPADMVAAFRYVFAAAAVLVACSTIGLIFMEERPLLGPAAKEGAAMMAE